MATTDRDLARTSPHRRSDVRTRWPVFAVLAAALPGALLTLVLLTDYLTPDPYYRFLAPLIVAVPALAAATSGVWGTVAFTCLGVAVNFLLASMDGRLYSPSFYGLMTALAIVFAISLLPGYQRARRQRQLTQARTVAETVQRAVLVPIPEQVDGHRTSAAYVAAEEEARIGGDLYDAVQTPYGIRLIIGDVRGKGLTSVGAAANLLGAFREAAPAAPDLPTLMERLEESVRRYNARVGLEMHDFVTVTVLSVPAEPVAQMLCCGHPGPLIARGGKVTDVQASRPSLPLGLGGIDTIGYHVDTLSFDTGDALLLYTDGVTEARDSAGSFYPLPERVAAWADAEPEHLVKQLVDDLTDYTGGRLDDDAAVLCLRRS